MLDIIHNDKTICAFGENCFGVYTMHDGAYLKLHDGTFATISEAKSFIDELV